MRNGIRIVAIAAMCLWSQLGLATTVYTRVGAKPTSGWDGTYLLVYEVSSTQAYVWNCDDASSNYVSVAISNGKISSDDLSSYQLTISAESSTEYGLRVASGYIGSEAKKNSLTLGKSAAQVCKLAMNSGYTDISTNNGTQMLLYSSENNRFRFYYDSNKNFTGYKHVYLYALGDNEVVESGNVLDINYAHAAMYACQSKFTGEQYYYTELFLAQEESYDAVPQVNLTILAPSAYSLVGQGTSATYKSSAYYSDGKALFIHETGGSAFSNIVFPSSEGGTTASIKEAVMTVTKVGASRESNAYVYHITLTLTDSNRKIWKLDKDLDVYGWWIDCDRSGSKDVDMEEVAFTFESGNHNSNTSINCVEEGKRGARKVVRNGQLLIETDDGVFDLLGNKL